MCCDALSFAYTLEPRVYISCGSFVDGGAWSGGRCCDSCHEDYNEGYDDMIEIYPDEWPGHNSFGGALVGRVCCALYNALKEVRQ